MTESIVSGNFTFRRTKLADVIVVEPKVYGDARGFFMPEFPVRCYSRSPETSIVPRT